MADHRNTSHPNYRVALRHPNALQSQSDGKPGLSIDDVVYSYYGNRSNSKLENKLNGLNER
jgi:hypothetical protein